MIIIYGMRLYGTVDRCGSTRIATKFVHIYGIPIIPLGSVLVLEDGIDGKTYRGLPLGLHLRSTAAAYARFWGIAAAVLAVVALSNFRFSIYNAGPIAFSVLTLAACVAAVVWGWGMAGRLGATQQAQRMVYADHAGYPIDVGHLRDRREPLRQALQKEVVEKAAILGATGYRMSADPHSAWDRIALDPTVTDRRFLGAALTLARLEWSLASGPDRGRLTARHDDIWKKIEKLDTEIAAAPTVA